jgi:ATP-dependent DNA ligase
VRLATQAPLRCGACDGGRSRREVQSTSRCLAFVHDGRAVLQSRQQRSLTRYFPEITAALIAQVPDGTVLDGELVIWRDGRFDFTALQRRIHPSSAHAARRSAVTSATLVVFDLLATEAADLRDEAYRRRRTQLRRLLADPRPPLALMPAARELDAAQQWMSEYHIGGIEGVVVKDRHRAYRPSRHQWEKVRIRAAADVVVCGVTGPLEVPETLLLGRRDAQGRLRVVGRTRRLQPAARAEVGALLRSPRAAHPWPPVIPSSRFGQLPPEPVVYTRADPRLVVEVDADVCWEQGRWRHPVAYLRPRLDLRPHDVAAVDER